MFGPGKNYHRNPQNNVENKKKIIISFYYYDNNNIYTPQTWLLDDK